MTAVVVAGVGYSQIGRNTGRSEGSLAVEAAKNALADAGLTAADLDGITMYPDRVSSVNDARPRARVHVQLDAPGAPGRFAARGRSAHRYGDVAHWKFAELRRPSRALSMACDIFPRFRCASPWATIRRPVRG